jgi:hypothetical protein
MKAIADTAFIVAFGNQADHHHVWAVNVAKNFTEPVLTCDARPPFTWVRLLTFYRSCGMTCCGLASKFLATSQPLAELARR